MGTNTALAASKLEVRLSATRNAVAASSCLTWSYLAMNTAATLIAAFGLLENSPAVIIGAMLVAMLFGPIVGVALALAEAQMKLLQRSLIALVIGSCWVFALGYIVGAASTRIPIGSEILARTSPTILDLLIALVGGIAGGYTFVCVGLESVIVGVAIATALVPPLTTCGLLMAHHLPTLAGGAFVLFFTNFAAIMVGAMGVFLFAGHRPVPGDARKVALPRLVSVGLVLLLGFHLTLALRNMVNQENLRSNIQASLSNNVAVIPGARFVNVELVHSGGATRAFAVVRTPQPLSPEQVAHLNDLVNRATGATISLHIRSVLTTETTRDGYVYEPSDVVEKE